MPNDDALSHASETTPGTDPMPLASALAALDPADDTHWTAAGKPSVAAVSDIAGAPVTRADIDAAAPDLTREAPATPEPQPPADNDHLAPGATPFPDPAPAAAPDELLRAHQRLNLLEEDIAFLRAKLGWPTKDRT